MWFNHIVSYILRSPFHAAFSGNTMLVSWTGSKSGKTYSTPVNYIVNENVLITTSLQRRTWWRSLRSGKPVTLYFRGKRISATGQVLEGEESLIPALQNIFKLMPAYARYFNVSMNENNEPVIEDLRREAQKRVIIYFTPQAE
ncbi:MAG: hypothetical protein LWX83_08775 [Anaerolineae bacterium]|nr:hypothetical protein [Anaerolineae bacterium]